MNLCSLPAKRTQLFASSQMQRCGRKTATQIGKGATPSVSMWRISVRQPTPTRIGTHRQRLSTSRMQQPCDLSHLSYLKSCAVARVSHVWAHGILEITPSSNKELQDYWNKSSCSEQPHPEPALQTNTLSNFDGPRATSAPRSET